MTDTTELDLTVEAGTTFTAEFFLKTDETTPLDLTGWEARSMIRKSYASAAPTLSFTSSPAAGLAIDALAGKITLTILPAQSSPLVTSAPREYYYDLEIYTVGGTVYRPFKGKVTINPEITR